MAEEAPDVAVVLNPGEEDQALLGKSGDAVGDDGAEDDEAVDYSWCCCSSSRVQSLSQTFYENNSSKVSYSFFVRMVRTFDHLQGYDLLWAFLETRPQDS